MKTFRLINADIAQNCFKAIHDAVAETIDTKHNVVVTIDFDTHIVLSKVTTVSMDYEPSMFSDGSWQLKINGIAVYSSYDSEKIKAMISFIKAKLEGR